MSNTRPRTFKEVVAAQDPTEMARLKRGDRFVDPSVNAFHGEVSVNEDRFGTGEWRVEYFDDDGGCYITIFAGPAAERRARDYYNSSLVVLASNETPSRSSRSRMSDIPRGTIFGRRVGDQPKSDAEHFIRCRACGGWI